MAAELHCGRPAPATGDLTPLSTAQQRMLWLNAAQAAILCSPEERTASASRPRRELHDNHANELRQLRTRIGEEPHTALSATRFHAPVLERTQTLQEALKTTQERKAAGAHVAVCELEFPEQVGEHRSLEGGARGGGDDEGRVRQVRQDVC